MCTFTFVGVCTVSVAVSYRQEKHFFSKGKEFLDHCSGHLFHGLQEWHLVCCCLTPVRISTEVIDWLLTCSYTYMIIVTTLINSPVNPSLLTLVKCTVLLSSRAFGFSTLYGLQLITSRRPRYTVRLWMHFRLLYIYNPFVLGGSWNWKPSVVDALTF